MLGAVLALAACGEGSTDATGTSNQTESTSTSIDANEAVTAYTQCMKNNGVDIGEPTTDADGNLTPGSILGLPQPGADPGTGQGSGAGLDEETQAALQECGGLLDGTGLGFGGPPGGGDSEALQEQVAELAACLEEQGLDIEQPDGEGQPGGPFGGLGGIDFEDPEVQAAMEQCAEFFPDFGGQGAPGGFGGQGDDDG
jgi:hypothetical protein